MGRSRKEVAYAKKRDPDVLMAMGKDTIVRLLAVCMWSISYSPCAANVYCFVL